MKRLVSLLLITICFALAAACANGCGGAKEGFALTSKQGSELGAVLDKLGLEYGYIDSGMDGKEIAEKFDEELKKGKAEGYTPVLVVGDSVLIEYLNYMIEDGYDPAAELKKELPDGKAVLDSRLAELENQVGDLDLIDAFGSSGQAPQERLSFSGIELAKMFGEAEDIALVKLHTENPWEAVILIPFGGWNDCPAPLDMAAVLKLWYENYGAVPAAISHDCFDMVLPAALSDENAEAAAREQAAFDSDIVLQGVALSFLKEDIKLNRIWAFWWD